jgi:hypothetical protein
MQGVFAFTMKEEKKRKLIYTMCRRVFLYCYMIRLIKYLGKSCVYTFAHLKVQWFKKEKN